MVLTIRSLLMSLMVLGGATPGSAGAWLQEKGGGFLSATTTGYQPGEVVEYRSAIYAEYGLLNRLTLGIDINDRAGNSGHALVFARLPLSPPDWRNRFAIELGTGAHHRLGRTAAMHKVTLSYGRGVTTGLGPAWVAADVALEHRTGIGQQIRKFDLTLGMSADRFVNPLLQIETAHVRDDELYWTVTPALLLRGKKGTRWLIGVERRSAHPDGFGLKFGFWRNF
ncbi:hypothetical protein Q5Y75_09075 [Ruegeria sp. 2205SS24-7]|uniref:hypothetical protein n=1 Tax=Ruegeria discodermiae TaxID=3064389 RepID=UPI00274184DD|nr:hypothetical protein [Ruegeria sp. 2205SS24-7]MDP5217365.1 hypothetical protein [Ruegeria sp. 2205SS24-7]